MNCTTFNNVSTTINFKSIWSSMRNELLQKNNLSEIWKDIRDELLKTNKPVTRIFTLSPINVTTNKIEITDTKQE